MAKTFMEGGRFWAFPLNLVVHTFWIFITAMHLFGGRDGESVKFNAPMDSPLCIAYCILRNFHSATFQNEQPFWSYFVKIILFDAPIIY